MKNQETLNKSIVKPFALAVIVGGAFFLGYQTNGLLSKEETTYPTSLTTSQMIKDLEKINSILQKQKPKDIDQEALRLYVKSEFFRIKSELAQLGAKPIPDEVLSKRLTAYFAKERPLTEEKIYSPEYRVLMLQQDYSILQSLFGKENAD